MRIRVLPALAILLLGCHESGAQQARNVILFLADAGGVPTVNAASIHGYGEPQRLFIQSWPHVALSDTSSASEWVSDSAAGMTAIVTGRKTHNGVISMGPDAIRGKQDGAVLKTVLEHAEERGLSTGVVSNVNIADATPAACYAHANARNKFGEIFLQVFAPRFGDGVDVVLGNGRQRIVDAVKALGRDLDAVATAKKRPVYATLEAVPAGEARPIAVLDGGLDVPAAARMAIDRLSRNRKGYFLMIEWDAHTNDPRKGLDNMVAFDRLIREVATKVNPKDTLLLFTADHSFDFSVHGGRRGEPLLKGLEQGQKVSAGTSPPYLELPNIRVHDDHTAEDVIVAAMGPGAGRVSGFMPNTRLFEIMLAAWGWRAVPTPGAAARPTPRPSAGSRMERSEASSTTISPADKATDVSVNAALSWPGDATAQFDVSFGTTNPPPFQARVERPSFMLETLSAGTTYYWRVDAVTAGGVSKGAVRQFTTARNAHRDEIYAWPIRIATSVRALYPNATDLGSWNYTEGMVTDALFRIATRTGRDADITYVREYLDRFVSPDGSLDPKAYPFELYSLDRIRPASSLLWMHDQTKDEKYLQAAKYVATQLDKQPRTSDGGYWHRSTYPNQMWLDGIYMAAVYAVQFGTRTGQPKHVDEAVRQISLIHRHTHDPATGLYYHGWDETRSRPWANRQTGTSPEFWGRAIGWYVMAMADVMDGLPPDHPGRTEVLSIFRALCRTLVKYQDRDTGLWWQIVDKPTAPKNYVETSRSAASAVTAASTTTT